ncbi:hypothetical protein FHS43_004334 [Streptosporangium becharense]|uniref:DUF4247 domain-containing protein n=1 Tax=Streptosporangium becharense TaxID=1816182 RepID=A0A7W9ID94_9ACTN|nr:hypothetical protein [Streptosporangium becharense]MBB2913039.1 hypothetical protein [Streptosporangium becharense]MBB5818136.1 hypothetical protein [Streptosporangium becharense]
MKASSIITLLTVGVVSLTVVASCLAGENDKEITADCVNIDSREDDGSYEVVDEALCDLYDFDDLEDPHGSDDSGLGYSYRAYQWYYGGVRDGFRASGGTTVRPSDARVSSRGGIVIQRGGFGGRGSSGS